VDHGADKKKRQARGNQVRGEGKSSDPFSGSKGGEAKTFNHRKSDQVAIQWDWVSEKRVMGGGGRQPSIAMKGTIPLVKEGGGGRLKKKKLSPGIKSTQENRYQMEKGGSLKR